jgi:hypothetical protein
VRNEVGLDVSHHTRISRRGGEKLFLLTSSFIGWSERYLLLPWTVVVLMTERKTRGQPV